MRVIKSERYVIVELEKDADQFNSTKEYYDVNGSKVSKPKSGDYKYVYACDKGWLFGGTIYSIKEDAINAAIHSSRQIKSGYTREDYDRFDEMGNFIPYKPTEEELAKKDEIKKVLEQELLDAYEPDPMDDYVGYDSTNERIDMACERVAKQFGVDTDFVDQIAGEIQNEENARQYEEIEWAEKNLKDDEYDKWYRGELDIRDRIHSSKAIKSSIEPWDVSQVTGTSDEDLGLSAVVEEYGNEFVNVDTTTLEQIKDKLVQYFDDEAYVRDWNINYPNDQIEDAFDVTDPEEMDVDDLAQYFDYEAYGRDIRLNDRIVWDTEDEHWVSLSEVEDENDDRYITW